MAAVRRYPVLAGVLVLVGALAAGVVSAEIILSHENPTTPATLSSAATAAAVGQSPISAAALYQQASLGVVTITTQTGGSRNRGEGTGSGIVLNRNGDILTNAHVVNGATQLQVTFHDGTTATATVTRTDSSADLAVIRASVRCRVSIR